MAVVVSCSFLALLFTFLEYKVQLRGGMKLGFLLITSLGVIHYDYGNDYMSYYELFKQIVNLPFDLEKILDGIYYHEPGWVLLCYLFKPLGGFFMMVAVLNIFQNIIVYNFIKRNVNCKWRTLALFVYLCVTSYYLMSFSMMRQMFVVIVFLGMWKYIIQRKWWVPIIIIYLCSFIHTSALILLPFSFWGFVPMNNTKYIGIAYVVLLVLLWLFQDILNNMFSFIVNLDEEFSEYTNRYIDNENTYSIGLGFILNIIPFILSIRFLLSWKEDSNVQDKSLVALGAISFLIAPFTQIIHLIGRVSVYFGIFSIALIPFVYGNIKNKVIRLGFLSLYVLITLYDYYLFFNKGIFAESYSSFRTIFG